MKPFTPKSNRPPRIPKENLDPTSVAAKPKNRITLPPRPPLASHNPRNTLLKRKLSLESPSKNAASQTPSPASDSGVQVIVRVRPRSKAEEEGEVIVRKILPNSVSILDHVFTFDSVADANATQEDIFELVGLPLVENCLAGFNSSIFAYGQTGSGKTYTMWGPLSALPEDASLSKEQGLTPRVFEQLFARIEEEQTKHFDQQLHCQCRCSFLEIYNEQITDLLNPTHRNLQIREDIKSGVYVDYLTEEVISTMKDVTGLLTKGLANRRTGATSINIESSRSHCVFTCVVEFRSKSMADGPTRLRTSRINLVDLAGSERQKLTGAGGERLKEAGNINRSLSQLGNLINILAEVSHSGKQRHIPYRDSKLTFLLQESLGGNAKMAMICAISPSQRCKSETFSTLRFAQSTKAIKNKAVVNEVTQDDVNVLREQIRQLKDEIVRMKSNGTTTNGSYSTAWNARRSLTLLKMSLNRPRTLPILQDDSDEEMEIDENDAEMPCNQAVSMSSSNSDRVLADLRISKSRARSSRCGNGINFEGLSATSAMEASSGEKVASGIGEYNMNKIGVDHVNLKASGQAGSSDVNADKQPESNLGDQENKILDFKQNEKNSPAKEEQNFLADQSYNCLSSPSDIVPCPLSIMPGQTSPASPMSISPLVESSIRKTPRASSPNSAADKNPSKKSISFAEISCVLKDSSSRASKRDIVPTEELEASLHRGLQVIDNMQHSSTLRSSFRFPATPTDTMPMISVNKVDAGVQTFIEEPKLEEKHTNVCCYCKSGTSLDKSKDGANATNMQLVLVEGSVPSDSEKLMMQVPKAVEKVLASSIRREMALEEQCANQAYEIAQLSRLVEQYKHERECNALITQIREEKISRLESLMDGILPTKEFLEEEFISLANEHKLLNEMYDHHPEVSRVNVELKRLQEELDGYKNFFDFGEREILFKEILQLRSQLQYYLDSSSKPTQNSTLMLKLTHSVGSTLDPSSVFLHTAEENADEKVEVARCTWTENESKWISLTEELRLELEASKSLAKKHRLELDAEKKCTEELKEALQTAMQGHARILEQYADLQEKHIALLAWEQRISDGIEDIKSTAAKASVRDDESNIIDSLAAEISVLRAEREKQRLYWKIENEGLQAQLKDTAEAVQAAGELLVRLKEAEEAVAAAEKKALLSERKTKEAYQEMDNLKKNYESEIVLLNQKLVQSHMTKEAPGTAESKLLESANYDDRDGLNEQRWKEDLEDFCDRGDTEPSKDTDPKSWFFGYDRCNI